MLISSFAMRNQLLDRADVANMKLQNILATMAVGSAVAAASGPELKALVYRGPASCDGCPEAVGDLLTSSPTKIHVTYAGPDEDTGLTAEALSEADIYAHPGGGGKIRAVIPPFCSR